MAISDFSCSFCLSCCSTPANCTSCWVNWLVSSGSSGFWFCSCVVSSVRKVWKLSAMPVVAVDAALLAVAPVLLVLVPETTGLGMVVSTDMVISSDPDVHAAACTEHAAVAASRRSGDGIVFADDQALRVGV